jgi:uncharacterized protein (TIGR00375 family)
MELIVDLHTHSHYSRATSPTCTLEELHKWGKIKGINIIGTGDFTHPLWFKELQQKLQPAEPGLLKLKEPIAKNIDNSLSGSIKDSFIRFVLTTEVSTIYSKGGKVRKLHQLIIVPSLKIAAQINAELGKIGNLSADGRHILGMDSKDLLKVVLDIEKENFYVPAHIWTPWFGMFGSKSGFDSIEEAFEEYAPYVKAIETGFSSDPFMNWRVDKLQNVSLISNSDAHSPSKLGREATILQCEPDYFEIINGIKTNDKRLKGTIEFFPQEGKYHLDGHRACNVVFTPEQTKELKGICPVCHRPLTIGVEYRVDQLASRPESYRPKNHKSVEYIVPLIEIISQLRNVGVNSKKVKTEYEKVYSTLGNEFSILRKTPIQEIENNGFSELAYAVDKLRKKEVKIQPGYDGVYGVVDVFGKQRSKNESNQLDITTTF